MAIEYFRNLLAGRTAGENFPTIPFSPATLVLLYRALPMLVASYGFLDQYADYLQSQSLEAYKGDVIEHFDFIIVGAGSAGTVLANRLTANPSFKVLILENGGNPNPVQSVPAFLGQLVHKPQIDYNYHTIPQRNSCLALRGFRSFWPRGKGIGGSSNLNAMFFQRGHPTDYDRWAELSGSAEWRFDNILRNFKNIEDYHGQYYDERWHSQNGQGVHVSVSAEPHLHAEFLEAGREMGYPTVDLNGRQEAGFSRLDVTIKNGRRFGAYPAFIKPILHRSNLKIYRYAKAIRVEIDGSGTAYGVTYIRHGVTRMARATKEIIVSAGSVDSPKLLMLSGIGPRDHLENLGIKCKVDLPVGQNMQDHIMTILPFTIETPKASFNTQRDVTLDEVRNYWTHGTGVMSTPMLFNAVGYVYSSVARRKMHTEKLSPHQVSPDIQLYLVPSPPVPKISEILEDGFSIKHNFIKNFFETEKQDGLLICPVLAKFKSRGYIKLASNNPSDDPIINPRYFSHPDDIKILRDGIDFSVNLVESTNAFQKHGAKLHDKHIPGCESFPMRSLQYYECYSRQLTLTVYHPCGTCTMGRGVGDPKAVVDPMLRVLHTKRLRVVDASIIPEVPNSNLNAATFMLGDKASEMILEEHQWK